MAFQIDADGTVHDLRSREDLIRELNWTEKQAREACWETTKYETLFIVMVLGVVGAVVIAVSGLFEPLITVIHQYSLAGKLSGTICALGGMLVIAKWYELAGLRKASAVLAAYGVTVLILSL